MADSKERVIEVLYDSETEGIIFRRSNGSTIWRSSKSLTSLVKYTFDAKGVIPPRANRVMVDADNAPDVSEIYIHRMDLDGKDNKFLLMQITTADYLYMQDMSNSDSHVAYSLLKPPKDDLDYVTFNVAWVYGSGVGLVGTGILVGVLI